MTERRTWLVSLDLPIEAADPAEAAAEFWHYLRELGPDRLPVFVAPLGDELAMRAYLSGQPHDLDPEDE